MYVIFNRITQTVTEMYFAIIYSGNWVGFDQWHLDYIVSSINDTVFINQKNKGLK